MANSPFSKKQLQGPPTGGEMGSLRGSRAGTAGGSIVKPEAPFGTSKGGKPVTSPMSNKTNLQSKSNKAYFQASGKDREMTRQNFNRRFNALEGEPAGGWYSKIPRVK